MAHKPTRQFSFDAIGSRIWVGIYQPVSADALQRLEQSAIKLTAEYNNTLSRFEPDSWVTHLANNRGTFIVPKSVQQLFLLYNSLYNTTAGAITPLVGELMESIGYDAQYSLQPRKARAAVADWPQAVQSTNGYKTITLPKPVLLDFGAAGKGYLVDMLAALLKTQDVQKFCIDAGGDMYAYGVTEPFTIGLEHPDNPKLAIGTGALERGALCASADNRRAWAGVHHIMDPRSLEPTTQVRATWVWAKTAAEADGLATALFLCEPKQLLQDFSFEFVRVLRDSSMQKSTNAPVEMFT